MYMYMSAPSTTFVEGLATAWSYYTEYSVYKTSKLWPCMPELLSREAVLSKARQQQQQMTWSRDEGVQYKKNRMTKIKQSNSSSFALLIKTQRCRADGLV